jgi:hypothetical protein
MAFRPEVEPLESRCLLSVSVGPNVNISRRFGNQNEAAIAVNPTDPNQLVVVSNEERLIGTRGGLFEASSSDGGRTWTGRDMATGKDGLPAACCDPQLVFDGFGNLFLTYIDNEAASQVFVLLSQDGGQTFTQIAHLGGGDQPSIAAAAGRVWVSFTDDKNTIAAAGATVTGLGAVGAFGTPQEVPGSANGDFGDIAIGPAGQVLVTYQLGLAATVGPDTIFVNQDAGGGFGPAVTVTATNVGGSDTNIPAQSNNEGIDAEANLAWDQSPGPHHGRVYLVYTDAAAVGSPETTLFVRSSDDGGSHWGDPVRVNDVTANSRFLPSIAVDQTTGDVAVAWYDARNSALNKTAQLFAAFSTDGGASFGPNVRVSAGASNSSRSEPPAPGARPLGYGDFELDKSAFVGGLFYPVWADNSNSTHDNPNGALSRLDLYTAPVALDNTAPSDLTLGLASASVTEGEAASLSGTFADPDFQGHQVVIDWGDGSAETRLTLAAGATGFGPVSHPYAEEKSTPYAVSVTVADNAGAATAAMTAVTVADAPLAATGLANVAFVEGKLLGRAVATFTDGNPNARAADFRAAIDWGDHSSSAGTVIANGGGHFTVTGSHAYADEGPYELTVSVRDVGGRSAQAQASAAVSDAPLVGQAFTLRLLPRQQFTGTVAAFTDKNPGAPLADFRATIDWGDGQGSPGKVVRNASGGFSVIGSHTYAEVGKEKVTVTVTDRGGLPDLAILSTALVGVVRSAL